MNSGNTQILTHEVDDEQLSRELLIAKFKNFAKVNFQESVKYEVDYIDYIRNISRHYAYNLADDVGEFFISTKNAPYFWISDNPIISAIENFLNGENGVPATVSSNYDEIKNFYSKWLTLKTEKEKQYFALSTINLIERNTNQSHILKKILYAVIVSFDDRIYSPQKSVDLLAECETITETLGLDAYLRAELLYLLNLYSGFVYLKMDQLNDALQKFYSAIQFKDNGISAYFYAALTEKRLQNRGKAIELLGKIVDFDQIRFKYAFDINSINLFNYFFQNAMIYNIFSEFEFSDYLFDLELFVPKPDPEKDAIFAKLFNGLFAINELDLDKYYDENIKFSLEFLSKFHSTYKQNKNMILPYSYQYIKSKFNILIKELEISVNKHYKNLVTVELKLYDEQEFRNTEEKKNRESEGEKIKTQFKKEMEATIKENDETFKVIISNMEKRIERLAKDVRFDPKLAFHNMMVYNVVVSMIIFIVGGFADGFMGEGDSGAFGYSSLTRMILSGIKWGGITILLGTIVSLFSSISAIWERSSKKTRIKRDIAIRKKQKERYEDEIKKQLAERISLHEANFKKKQAALERDNKELVRDKEKKSAELLTRYEDIIGEVQTKLNSLVMK